MKKYISLTALALCTVISATSVNAATGSWGNCGKGYVTGSGSTAINIKVNDFALVLIDGNYCGIESPTDGEAAVIRSVAKASSKEGRRISMNYYGSNGVVVFSLD